MIQTSKEILTILGKTAVVFITVVFGFAVIGLLHLPSWTQGLGFIPAMYVFCKLSEQRSPPVRKWLPWLIGVGLLGHLLMMVLPYIPEAFRTLAYVIFALMVPRLLGLLSRLGGKPKSDRA